MTTVITATKCLRPSCKNRSADPETDNWAYIDFEQLVVGFAPETGFYCKPCADEIMDVLEEAAASAAATKLYKSIHNLNRTIRMPQTNPIINPIQSKRLPTTRTNITRYQSRERIPIHLK